MLDKQNGGEKWRSGLGGGILFPQNAAYKAYSLRQTVPPGPYLEAQGALLCCMGAFSGAGGIKLQLLCLPAGILLCARFPVSLGGFPAVLFASAELAGVFQLLAPRRV